MRILKSHPLLKLANSYLIDGSQPSNLNFAWNFGSLLAVCLIIQIVTGVTLAMHVRCDSVLMSRDLHPNVSVNAFMSVELGSREISLLNIASQFKAVKEFKPIWVQTARHYSYGKTHTSRTTLPIAFKLGGPLVGNRINDSSNKINACLFVTERITSYTRSIMKGREIVPKWNIRTLKTNTGLPKGGNSYGNGSIIVPALNSKYALSNVKGRERIEASLLFNRTYVSGGDIDQRINVGSKLNKLSLRSINNPKSIIDRPLYSLLYNVEMLRYAYENIKSKPRNIIPGILPEILDSMSEEVLQNISTQLKHETFKFSTKYFKGTKPLTIAPPRDKIVQEAIRLILEAIYEPLFLECSHGFRSKKGYHTVLNKISQDFQTTQWIIKGDISKCLDKIEHQKLMKILEQKIGDKRFTKLVWKAITAGYLEFREFKNNMISAPQGSIVSPILVNIFLHQLDEFVMELKTAFDKKERASRIKESRYFEYYIAKAIKNKNKTEIRKLIALRSLSLQTNLNNESYRRLSYVRYAEDWMVGIRGTAEETTDILRKIKKFCTNIGIEVSETKTKITNIQKEKVLFLGTLITKSSHRSYSKIGHQRRLRRNKLGIRLEAPISRIRDILKEASFIKKGKSHPKFLWLHNDHDQIILLYNSVLRDFLNYYNFAFNYGRLATYVEFILKQSCAKLLASKFNLQTTAQVYKQFGEKLTSPKGYEFYKPSKITLKFLTSSSSIIGSLYQKKTSARRYVARGCYSRPLCGRSTNKPYKDLVSNI